jgi:hypothetical protein
MRNPVLAVFLAIPVLLSGCGYAISPYGVSVDNVNRVRASAMQPMAVARFSAGQPSRSSIGCRAAGPVETPNQVSFESYIERALIDELQLGGAYDPNSPIKLQGTLEEIDFNSNIGAGKWVFRLAVSSAVSPGFTVSSQHEFSTNWVADKACQQVAQAFVPAVQHLIADVISHPQFKALSR